MREAQRLVPLGLSVLSLQDCDTEAHGIRAEQDDSEADHAARPVTIVRNARCSSSWASRWAMITRCARSASSSAAG